MKIDKNWQRIHKKSRKSLNCSEKIHSKNSQEFIKFSCFIYLCETPWISLLKKWWKNRVIFYKISRCFDVRSLKVEKFYKQLRCSESVKYFTQFLNDLISIDFFYREDESILIEEHLTTVGFIFKTVIICPYPRYVKFHTDFVLIKDCLHRNRPPNCVLYTNNSPIQS